MLVQLCGHYSRLLFNRLNCLGNAQQAVIRSIGVAILLRFAYNGSVCMFNQDQGCWRLYHSLPLLRSDRYVGFHCIVL